MSESQDRRESPRIVTSFSLLLMNEQGAVLDDRALAHDVSEKGFQAETQLELKQGQIFRYRLSLVGDSHIHGKARVAWSRRTDMSHWAGAAFLGISWSDRRRIRKLIRPSEMNWDAVADKAIFTLTVLLVTTLGSIAAVDPNIRAILPEILPVAAAAVIMGMALIALIRR